MIPIYLYDIMVLSCTIVMDIHTKFIWKTIVGVVTWVCSKNLTLVTSFPAQNISKQGSMRPDQALGPKGLFNTNLYSWQTHEIPAASRKLCPQHASTPQIPQRIQVLLFSIAFRSPSLSLSLYISLSISISLSFLFSLSTNIYIYTWLPPQNPP